eukprot:3961001-Pyramimonas_sp.AAC.1
MRRQGNVAGADEEGEAIRGTRYKGRGDEERLQPLYHCGCSSRPWGPISAAALSRPQGRGGSAEEFEEAEAEDE